MGRGKIERETKGEKINFRLGGTQKEGEYKVLPPSRRQPRRREQRVGHLLEDSQGGKSKVLLLLKEIISVCVRAKKNKRIFFSHETYTRIIIIDLIIVKLFGVCPMIFPLKEKRFST